MHFNISNFRSEIDRHGVLRTNRHQFIFTSPRGLSSEWFDTRALTIRCDSTTTPAVFFAVNDQVRRYGYGPIERAPEEPLFDAVPASFIVDKDGFTHKFFYDWLSLITNFDGRSMQTHNKFSALPYESSYRQDFVTDVFIIVYDEAKQEAIRYHLVNAWPHVISESPLDWGDTDQILKLNVSFFYRDWNQTTISSHLFNSVSNLIGPDDGRILGNSSRLPIAIMDTILTQLF